MNLKEYKDEFKTRMAALVQIQMLKTLRHLVTSVQYHTEVTLKTHRSFCSIYLIKRSTGRMKLLC